MLPAATVPPSHPSTESGGTSEITRTLRQLLPRLRQRLQRQRHQRSTLLHRAPVHLQEEMMTYRMQTCPRLLLHLPMVLPHQRNI